MIKHAHQIFPCSVIATLNSVLSMKRRLQDNGTWYLDDSYPGNVLSATKKLVHKLTWKATCAVKMSLSLSNRPLVVYMNTENEIQSIRFTTRCTTSPAASAFSIAFSKTTLNAWEENKQFKYDVNLPLRQVTGLEISSLLRWNQNRPNWPRKKYERGS